jgi:putative transposase
MEEETRPPSSHRLRTGRVTLRAFAYLLTTVTAKRRALFENPTAAGVVAQSLQHFHDRDYVHGFAWVVMPDHFHWLVQLRTGTLDNLMRRLKAWTGYRIRKVVAEPPPRVWQPGYHDRCVRPHESLRSYVEYLVANPVRWGLVQNPKDYPYLYAEHEVLDIHGSEPKPFAN